MEGLVLTRLSGEGVGGLPREGVAGGCCGFWAFCWGWGSWGRSTGLAALRELPYDLPGRQDGFETLPHLKTADTSLG